MGFVDDTIDNTLTTLSGGAVDFSENRNSSSSSSNVLRGIADEFFKSLADEKLTLGNPLLNTAWQKLVEYQKPLRDKVLDTMLGEAKHEKESNPGNDDSESKASILEFMKESLKIIEGVEKDWAQWQDSHYTQRDSLGMIDNTVYVYDQFCSNMLTVQEWKRTDFDTGIAATAKDQTIDSVKRYRKDVGKLLRKDLELSDFIKKHGQLQNAGLSAHHEELREGRLGYLYWETVMP